MELQVTRQLAKDKAAMTRCAAVVALSQIATVEEAPVLVESLSDNGRTWFERRRICDIAAQGLESIGSFEARTALEQWKNEQVQHD